MTNVKVTGAVGARARTSAESVVEVAIAAVPAASITAWVANANRILDRLVASATRAPFRIPPETVLAMRDALDAMSPPDAGADDLVEQALMFEPGVLRDLITYWFNITKLTDAQRADLDIEFGVADAEDFAQALAAAVGAAMVAHPPLAEFAARLAAEWEECQPSFSDAAGTASAPAT